MLGRWDKRQSSMNKRKAVAGARFEMSVKGPPRLPRPARFDGSDDRDSGQSMEEMCSRLLDLLADTNRGHVSRG